MWQSETFNYMFELLGDDVKAVIEHYAENDVHFRKELIEWRGI